MCDHDDIARHPNAPLAFHDRAVGEGRLGSFGAAVGDVTRSTAVDHGYVRRAGAFRRSGLDLLAIGDGAEAPHRQPGDAGALFGLGEARRHLGRAEAAVAGHSACLAAAPGRGDAHRERGAVPVAAATGSAS